jgi:hypothetical protein
MSTDNPKAGQSKAVKPTHESVRLKQEKDKMSSEHTKPLDGRGSSVIEDSG